MYVNCIIIIYMYDISIRTTLYTIYDIAPREPTVINLIVQVYIRSRIKE